METGAGASNSSGCSDVARPAASELDASGTIGGAETEGAAAHAASNIADAQRTTRVQGLIMF